MTVIPFKPKNSLKRKSQMQEKQTAKDLNGKTTIASGALVQKGDCFTDHCLVECKTTEKLFYSLKLTTWNKIKNEARNSNLRIPVMRIDLNDGGDKFSYAILRDKDLASWCFGKAIYVLDLVPSAEKSCRITPLSNYYVNAPIVIGKHFSVEAETNLVQIPWEEFVALYKMNYGGENDGT